MSPLVPSDSIGFVGLGAMGGAIARNLATAGWTMRVFDLNGPAIDRTTAAGAAAASSAKDAVTGSAVVFSSLPTPELVEKFWAEQAPNLASGSIAVDLSTIDPATSRRISDMIAASTSASFVACTVGKTPAHAEKGEIPAFVGGSTADIERLAPLLKVLSNDVYDMGSVEGATIFKLVSNLVGMSNLAILAEGYVLARRAGIPADRFTEALRTTGGWSVQADLRLDWMVADDLAPRFAVDMAAKDLRLSVNAAAEWHVPTPVAAASLAAFTTASASGHGALDAAAIVEPLDPRRVARGERDES
ncbi:NAD(P)-dependent oxidoreductase [Cryobacterium mannosilyticum]|uniref:NAD(P)-dependent oxidoreductase n=2 Tax=Cryobacterium mannosilyticum TaxID=1259190 RepID=A0A4R8WDU3_9MICO|nr:NAD(P)-dependent oxidoreductase [Cryobacterium mannosilyticum]